MFQFDPAQLVQMSLIGQVGGELTSGIGSFYSAKNSRITLEGQADIADINARIAEMGAQQELIRGQHEVGRLTLQAGQLKGRQRSALAANGVDLGVGSAAEVQASTDLMKEVDKNTITTNAARSAFGYRIQAGNFRNEALMKRATAGAINPGMNAGTTLLGGMGRVATSWYLLNKVGVQEDVRAANQADDPIEALGAARGWW